MCYDSIADNEGDCESGCAITKTKQETGLPEKTFLYTGISNQYAINKKFSFFSVFLWKTAEYHEKAGRNGRA
jgi:hypothetical protein